MTETGNGALEVPLIGDDSRWDALEALLPLVYVAEFDRAGTFRYLSPLVREWTGHSPEEFLGDSSLWYRCIHPHDVGRVREAEEKLFESKEQLNLEYRLVGPDGEPRWVWERNTIVRDGRGMPMCTHGTIVDLSRLGAEAVGDAADGVGGRTALMFRRSFLTGLPSRQVLHEHLALALGRSTRQAESVALLDIDLDHFRGINDLVGHAGGDIAIAQVADRMKGAVKPGDLLLHSGADEFLIMTSGLEPDAADEAARALAARIVQALKAPFEVTGRLIDVRASIGYAISPAHGNDPEELHRSAHAALAAAKAAGRGEVHRYAPTVADAGRMMSVDHRLRRAIERDEIGPHYQPIVDLATDRICAVEALVRWEPAGGEVVMPGEFIAAAEETSLIIDLDLHMLRRVCADISALRHRGHSLPAHVNISSRVVTWPGFVRAVLAAIDEAGLQPRDLVIEVTETSPARDAPAVAALVALAEAGTVLSLDDYGAGYSSLERLRTWPIRIIKVDRVLLLGATGDLQPAYSQGPASHTVDAGRKMLAGVIRMGKELGLKTIVEGVETVKSRDMIVEYGADMAQGWYFGRPAPFDALLSVLPGG